MTQLENRPIVQKANNLRSKKLTDSARGQDCQNCGANDGTTVSAHANSHKYGKGKSMKASDVFIAWLCADCHSWLDQGTGFDPTRIWVTGEKEEMWQAAHIKTLVQLFEQGFIKIT